MPTSTTVKGLNINELTEAQYDAAVQGGVIGPNELSVLTDVSYVEPSDLATVATTGDYDDLINKPTIPAALPDQTGHSGEFLTTDGTDASWAAVNALPDQTGHSGEFLTTNGTDASWTAVNALQNNATGSDSLAILGSASCRSAVVIGDGASANGASAQMVVIGSGANSSSNRCVAIGLQATGAGYDSVAIGAYTEVRNNGVVIGRGAQATAVGACQICINGTGATNSDANTFKVANANGNFEIMSADGTIPEARLADTTNAQQGDVLTLDSNGDAVWQAGSGGGLQNTATGTDGLTILGTASTVNYSINIGVNSKVSQTSGVAIGRGAEARAYQSSKLGTAIGTNAFVEGEAGVAIGSNSCSYANASGYAVSIGGFATAYDYGIAIGTRTQVFNTAPGAIQLGNCWTNNTSPTQNMDAHTFKVGLRTGTNYELLSSDGTIPTARLTKVNSTITLTAAGWSGGSQTVTVTGMTATGVVLVSPDPTDQSAYTSAGIICTAQAADSLTFTCSTTPSADIDVNVVML